MGILKKLFGPQDPDEAKQKKFRELENMFSGDPEMINLTKASWLASSGCYYGKQGKYDDAIRYFKEAIKLKPDHSQAYVGWGTALRETGKLDEALDVLFKAPMTCLVSGKEVFDSEFEIWNQIAGVYIMRGDKRNFAEAAKKVIEAARNPKRKDQLEWAIKCGAVRQEDCNDDEIVSMLQAMMDEF